VTAKARPVALAAAAVVAAAAAFAPHGRAAAAPRRTFVFVHDGGDHGSANQVFVFRATGNGRLRRVRGSPFVSANADNVCSGDCQTVAYSEARGMLFTTGSAGVSAWTVAANGALAEVAGSPFGGAGTLGVGAADTASGTFVYATSEDSDQVLGFRVEAGGTLSAVPGSPFATGSRPLGVTTFGDVVLVANQGFPFALHSFKAQPDGALAPAPGSPFSFGARNYHVYASRVRPCVVVPDCSQDPSRVDALALDPSTGTLSEAPGSPATSGADNCGSAAVGEDLVVSFSGSGVAQTFRIGADCSLAPRGRARASRLLDVAASAFTPGDALLVASDYDANVFAYAVSPRGRLRRVDAERIAARDVSGMAVGRR
jgi:hypothetical protein